MSIVNYMIYGGYKEIPREEYYEWFKNASIIREESCVISNFCGPHEFSTTISKNGMTYELGWGWHVENGKTIDWYGVRKLHIDHNQNGDGIYNKPAEQPSDPNWTAPEINEWSPELLKDLERVFGKRGCWPVSIEYRQWIESNFDKQFKNINYKAQYFDQTEFDRIRKKRGLI